MTGTGTPSDPGADGCVRWVSVQGELPELVDAVLDLVDTIPPGQVLTYGDVARMVGRCSPRQVGAVMARYGGMTSWWRVVSAAGALPPDLTLEARERWQAEGTPLRGTGATPMVDLARARWPGPEVVGPGW